MSASPSRICAGPGRSRSPSTRCQLDKATEYAAEDADVALRLWMRFRARLPFEKATRVYEMVDRPMVAVVGAMERDGVKVDREVLKSPVGRVQRPDRRARGEDLRRGRLQVHHRLARSSWATSCSTRWAFRAAARASPAPGRPTSPNWSGWRARACRSPSWCSTGASSPSSNPPIPTRCRSRSTARPGRVHTSYSASRARRPGGSPRPTPTS